MPSRDFKRTDRINAELRRELGMLVHRVVMDHGLPSVSINDVDVAPNLESATVWVTTLRPDDADAAVKGLRALSGRLRHELGKHVRLRRVPALRFKYDESVDRAERIDALLRDNPPREES